MPSTEIIMKLDGLKIKTFSELAEDFKSLLYPLSWKISDNIL